MRVALLPATPSAIHNALLSHGQESVVAGEAAHGAEPVALHATGLLPAVPEALLTVANRLGLDLFTGPDWIILVGARSRLATFARPWGLPPVLGEFALAAAKALPGEVPSTWSLGTTSLALIEPAIVGIVNCTPDSFSADGVSGSAADAENLARFHLEAGATMLDLGGQSTRPGADETSPDEEISRVVPALKAIRSRWPEVPISIDTVRSEVVRAALPYGVQAVNDVSAGRLDPELFPLVAEAGIGMILMHSRGGISDMASYRHARYAQVMGEVVEEIEEALDRAQRAGIRAEACVVDPGFGFGKTVEQNYEVAAHLACLRTLGRPVYVGPSRKRFLGDATGRPVDDRDRATAALATLLWAEGARLFRVHNVGEVVDALAVASAVFPVRR